MQVKTRLFFLYILLHVCIGLNAQTAISGAVNTDDIQTLEAHVYLMEVGMDPNLNLETGKLIGKAPIQKDGTFAFERTLLSSHNTIYKIYVNRIQEFRDRLKQPHNVFILSNTDSLHFKKGNKLFSEYYTTNKADREWQRFRKFQQQFLEKNVGGPRSAEENYVEGIKQFTKDSLQILWVKLHSIRQLEEKKLLDTDIEINPDYYIALLNEFKESELLRADYLFLENKLAFLKHHTSEKKYAVSSRLNVILISLILVFCAGIISWRLKNNPGQLYHLSQRERSIQQLMLQGKSNKEIADELFISVSTVKTHITHIYHKLSVTNRKELLQKCKNYTSTST